ncbi:hypothetical protein DAPPUDRAFT_300206 [Daphnia pulex]|uniref:Uncharacterized protein n=1 Tax=Daphnia pulex TaxID=6669 RepID=E9G5A6_DAPPU|nr:hypothetical protein DAPPUDRAFT_300206 [Daphnia pulex]|eukprot:EFX85175.1 hypothetical protein DAPPUDRAFT_300206 [Daphnia pulex]
MKTQYLTVTYISWNIIFLGGISKEKYSFSLSFGKFQNYPVHFAAGTFLVVIEQKEKDKKKIVIIPISTYPFGCFIPSTPKKKSYLSKCVFS